MNTNVRSTLERTYTCRTFICNTRPLGSIMYTKYRSISGSALWMLASDARENFKIITLTRALARARWARRRAADARPHNGSKTCSTLVTVFFLLHRMGTESYLSHLVRRTCCSACFQRTLHNLLNIYLTTLMNPAIMHSAADGDVGDVGHCDGSVSAQLCQGSSARCTYADDQVPHPYADRVNAIILRVIQR